MRTRHHQRRDRSQAVDYGETIGSGAQSQWRLLTEKLLFDEPFRLRAIWTTLNLLNSFWAFRRGSVRRDAAPRPARRNISKHFFGGIFMPLSEVECHAWHQFLCTAPAVTRKASLLLSATKQVDSRSDKFFVPAPDSSSQIQPSQCVQSSSSAPVIRMRFGPRD